MSRSILHRHGPIAQALIKKALSAEGATKKAVQSEREQLFRENRGILKEFLALL
jgi:hypothetical protein